LNEHPPSSDAATAKISINLIHPVAPVGALLDRLTPAGI